MNVSSTLMLPVGLVLLVATACGGGAWTPERPAGVPQTAYLAGGIDGGDWLDCTKMNAIQFYCDVYPGVTGIRRKRVFFQVCVSQIEIREQMKGLYQSEAFQFQARAFEFREPIYFEPGEHYDAPKLSDAVGLDPDCTDLIYRAQ